MKKTYFALLMGAGVVTSVLASTSDDIRTLMAAGRYNEAYQLGKQQTDELGDPGFDFYYGIAALDGGNPGEGVLALERFLLRYPANRSARFHLGRGYYILGEDLRARAEFTPLLDEADEAEKVSIQRFLDAIRGRESRYIPTSSFFAEFGIGHDSNINAGASTGSVAGLPGFSISPAGTSARESDNFYTLLAGVQGSQPLAPGLMLYGGLQGNGRWHSSRQNDLFDQINGLAQGGITAINGRNLYRAGLEYHQLALDNQNYMQAVSLLGEWGYQLDQFNRLGLNVQYSQLRYDNITIFLDKQKTLPSPSGSAQRDGNLTLLSASWTHAFLHEWNPLLTVSLSLGEERNIRNRAEYSRELYGARTALILQPAEKLSLSAALAYQNSRYQDFFSGASAFPKRKDDYRSLELGATYALDRNWSVRAEGTWADQRSNVGLYDYGREVFAIKLRYDFK